MKALGVIDFKGNWTNKKKKRPHCLHHAIFRLRELSLMPTVIISKGQIS